MPARRRPARRTGVDAGVSYENRVLRRKKEPSSTIAYKEAAKTEAGYDVIARADASSTCALPATRTGYDVIGRALPATHTDDDITDGNTSRGATAASACTHLGGSVTFQGCTETSYTLFETQPSSSAGTFSAAALSGAQPSCSIVTNHSAPANGARDSARAADGADAATLASGAPCTLTMASALDCACAAERADAATLTSDASCTIT